MYAFFFVGGVTFSAKNEMPFFKWALKEIKQLYIPYLIYAFMWDVTKYVMACYLKTAEPFSVYGILKNVASVFIGGGVFKSSAAIGAAWFLLSLLVLRLLFCLVVRVTKNNKLLLGAVSVGLFIIGYYFSDCGIGLPFKIEPALTAVLYFYLGYIGKDFLEKFEEESARVLVALSSLLFITVGICSVYMNSDLLLISAEYPDNLVLMLLGSLSGCFGLVTISMLISKMSTPLLEYYGRNSLTVMGTHSEVHMLCALVFEGMLHINGTLLVIPIFLVTLIASILIIEIVNRYIPILARGNYGHKFRLRH